MSNMKDKLTEEVKKIDSAITNQSEKETVLNAVQNMIGIFTQEVINVNERQQEMEDRLEDIYEVLSTIEEEMISTFGMDIESECPYCGETIPFTLPEEGEDEIECPHCHNSIELELMFDEHKCGCGCDCDECDDDCDCGCNCGDDCDCDDECDCGCNCGDDCDCDDDCDCGCNCGDDCDCDDECDCGCNCGDDCDCDDECDCGCNCGDECNCDDDCDCGCQDKE